MNISVDFESEDVMQVNGFMFLYGKSFFQFFALLGIPTSYKDKHEMAMVAAGESTKH